MPKRTNTNITDYKLKSGSKRWKIRVFIGRKNGRKIETTRRGFKSYAEAEEEYNKLKSENVNTFVKQKQIKLGELYKLWFSTYEKQVKSSTANKTNINYRVHIKPYFDKEYIDKIPIKDFQKWIEEMSVKLVKYRDPYNTLHSIYEYAIRLGYISYNPLNRIIIPKKTARKRRDTVNNVYTHKQLADFLATAKEISVPIYTYFKLLASTGLRKSEALALHWKDIDFKNGLINVNKTLALALTNKVIVQSPKSNSSIRQVPISKSLSKDLKVYKKNASSKSGKLFHTQEDNYLTLSKPDSWLGRVYRKNKDLKRITIHGFRHTFATLLIEDTNVKPKTVQMILGHSTIQMTLDIYTHINNNNKAEAKSSIEKLGI